MPNFYFVLFELVIYVQFSLCLIHAWRHGAGHLLRLLAGVLFGVMLELATIRQLHAYEYGQFLLMVLDVPLCIGVAWSAILYSAMEFSDASSMPYWGRPVLDALLALNIDLALDAVAIRFGFWDWGNGLGFEYFGVPYANFWAWFWVVFSFSLGYRILARRRDWAGAWLSPALALVLGLAGVLGSNALIVFATPPQLRTPVIFSTLAVASIITVGLRPRFNLTPVPPLVFWVPFLTHAYVLIAGLIAGILLGLPILLWVGLLMTAIAFYLHRQTILELRDSLRALRRT